MSFSTHSPTPSGWDRAPAGALCADSPPRLFGNTYRSLASLGRFSSMVSPDPAPEGAFRPWVRAVHSYFVTCRVVFRAEGASGEWFRANLFVSAWHISIGTTAKEVIHASNTARPSAAAAKTTKTRNARRIKSGNRATSSVAGKNRS